MIFVVLYKQLNCAAVVTLPVLTVTNDYRKILLIMLFITSWCKPLNPDSSSEIGPYAAWLKPSFLAK